MIKIITELPFQGKMITRVLYVWFSNESILCDHPFLSESHCGNTAIKSQNQDTKPGYQDHSIGIWEHKGEFLGSQEKRGG